MEKLKCRRCGVRFNGTSTKENRNNRFCPKCLKHYTRRREGRPGKELDRVNEAAIKHQVKVFTREEIDAVAHLYTPPVKRKGTVCMESKPLPDFGDEYGRN